MNHRIPPFKMNKKKYVLPIKVSNLKGKCRRRVQPEKYTPAFKVLAEENLSSKNECQCKAKVLNCGTDSWYSL